MTQVEPSAPRPNNLFGLGLVALDLATMRLSTWWSTWLARGQLALLGCSCGRNLRADGRVIIRARKRGAICIGDNVRFNSRPGSNLVGLSNPMILHCIRDGQIIIGDNSGCSGAVLSARSRITIGQHVLVGGNVRIFDHDYHSLDAFARQNSARDREQVKAAPVVIGDGVFIGANSIILKGVEIGERSVVGAGSVVTLKSIPPDSLVAGNPARILRTLQREK